MVLLSAQSPLMCNATLFTLSPSQEKYDLVYDDGDMEKNVPRYRMRSPLTATDTDTDTVNTDRQQQQQQHFEQERMRELCLGLRVDACHGGGRQAYPGRGKQEKKIGQCG